MDRGSNPGNTGGGGGGAAAGDLYAGDSGESGKGKSGKGRSLGRVIVKGGRRIWRSPSDLNQYGAATVKP